MSEREHVAQEDEPRKVRPYELLRYTDDLPTVFRRQMEHLETVHRWLAGYLHAVAVLLQIPGGAAYHYADNEVDDELWGLIWSRDPGLTFGVLAAALKQLDAPHVLGQVTGGGDYPRGGLSRRVRVHLAKRDRNGLLNVVAECLDRLLVVPELEEEAALYEIDPRPRRRWWPFGRKTDVPNIGVRARPRTGMEDC
jgi:hypothetical protein